MALLDSKQLNPKLTGSFILSGSTQTFIGASDFQGSITASGDISASGTVFADTFQSTGGDVDGISFTDDLNLSGNFTASGDISGSGNIFGTGNLDIDGTSNLEGNVTLQNDLSVSGNITGSNDISASGNLSVTGNLDIDGTSNFAGNVTMQNDLSVTGRIDAEEIHTTFISSSITQATGSNIFGDEQTDIHQFTGSLNLTGSLTTTGKIELGREPVQGINYLARLAEGKLSLAASAHTFTATAATKTSNHPYKDSGSSLGYIIDGVETPFLYLTEGYYKFDYSGATSHPIRFYFDAAKTTEYNPSTHVSVDGNVITLLIDKDSPQIIYYQCSSHGFMGWAIHTGQNALVQDINGFKTLVSGSAQIAADISGSFSKAQLDAKVANVVTSSAQIATDISGSSTALSASLSTRLTTFDISQIDLDGGTDIGAAIVDADLIILDDGATGTNRKATMSRLKSYMSGVSGGSTLGNVQVGVTAATEIDTTSGNLIIDSDGGTVEITDDVNITGHITASANISASGNIFGTGNLDIDGTSNLQGNVTLQNDLSVTGNITGSGNISGSHTSTGSFGHVSVDELTIPSLSQFSSSIATQLNTLTADVIALSIALG